jgi:cell division protein FtsN
MADEPLTNFGQRKSSLMSAVGERQQGNVLQEYTRRFNLPIEAPASDKGYHLVVQALARAEEADTESAPDQERPAGFDSLKRRVTALRLFAVSAASATPHFLTRVQKLVTPSGIALKAAAIVCAFTLLSASVYQALPTFDDGEATGGKAVNDRLRPSQPRPATVSAALSSVDAATLQPPRDLGGETASPEPQQQSAAAPSHPALPDKPIVVRSEVYLPDGTRADARTPSAIPSVVRLDSPKPPLLAASASVAAAPAQSEGPSLAVASAAPPEPAKQEQKPESGYYVQVKSDQDSNAAEAERGAVLEKHGGDLGKLALFVRQVDLKEKGVWFRVLAGPSKTRDEAERLCRKMKRSGLSGCVIQQIE